MARKKKHPERWRTTSISSPFADFDLLSAFLRRHVRRVGSTQEARPLHGELLEAVGIDMFPSPAVLWHKAGARFETNIVEKRKYAARGRDQAAAVLPKSCRRSAPSSGPRMTKGSQPVPGQRRNELVLRLLSDNLFLREQRRFMTLRRRSSRN